MAITFVAEYVVPLVDDAAESSASFVFDKDAAGWSSLVTNDVVIMFAEYKVASTTCSVSTTGGQTWTENLDATLNGLAFALYTCVFNGTWTADPVVTNTGASPPRTAWAAGFTGVDTTTPWEVAPVAQAQASASSYTEATWNTTNNNAWAVVGGGANDDNTWSVDNSFVAVSGSGNIYRRTAGGTDCSIALTRKAIPTAGAVGATVLTLATLGPDSGWSWHGALKAAAGAAATSLIYPRSNYILTR